MKKRIISLLMALCLIIGLLPLTAFAEEAAGPLKKVAFTTKAGVVKEKQGETEVVVEDNTKVFTENLTAPVYGKTSADGLTMDWTNATSTDYNIAVNQSSAGLEIELKDAYMKITADLLYAIEVEYDGPVTVKLVGKNVIETEGSNTPACLYLRAQSSTITGGGSLTANSIGFLRSNPVYNHGSTLDCDGDLTIKDVTLDLKQTSGGDPYVEHTIRCSGNVVIDGATVKLYAQWGSGIQLSTSRSSSTTDTTGKTITIKNGAKVSVESNSWAFRTGDAGAVIIDATNATDVTVMSKVGAFRFTPTLQNANNATILSGTKIDGSDAAAYNREANQSVTSYKDILYFYLGHTHTGGTATCTKKAVCTICSNEYGELAAHTYTRTDCSKDSVCSACNQVIVPAGTHTGGTATCKDKAVCTICKQSYGELGTHTGGTANCKEKAKCDVCKAEYGALGDHIPEADDKNCTTAQYCTICKKELTAAKTHRFLNDKDNTCENFGCDYVRNATANPGTGDISVLLTAAVALSSAVGFAGITVLRKKEN